MALSLGTTLGLVDGAPHSVLGTKLGLADGTLLWMLGTELGAVDGGSVALGERLGIPLGPELGSAL